MWFGWLRHIRQLRTTPFICACDLRPPGWEWLAFHLSHLATPSLGSKKFHTWLMLTDVDVDWLTTREAGIAFMKDLYSEHRYIILFDQKELSSKYYQHSIDRVCKNRKAKCYISTTFNRVVAAVVVVGQKPWLRISGNCYSTRQGLDHISWPAIIAKKELLVTTHIYESHFMLLPRGSHLIRNCQLVNLTSK